MASATPRVDNAPSYADRRGVAGWMLFDWAAQPFFTVVTTFVFGPYFVSRMASDPVTGQSAWAWAVSVAGLVIAVLSPLLGSVADQTGYRKRWIGGLALLKISGLVALWWAAPGSDLLWVLSAFVLATVCAELSIVVNDSMLPSLAPLDRVGRISSTAWGVGFAGGMVVLVFVIGWLAEQPDSGLTLLGNPSWWGLDTALGEDARIAGPLAAVWYAVFILPMMLFTPDKRTGVPTVSAVTAGLHALRGTLAELRTRPVIFRFLMARMFYQDGVNALLAMGAAFAAALYGWSVVEVGVFGIVLNITAIFGCLLASRMDSRLGARRTVMGCLWVLMLALGLMVATGPDYTLFGWVSLTPASDSGWFNSAAERLCLFSGMLIGFAFGPVQSASRTYLAESVPAEDAGRYFGMYALTGRATSFLAPALVGLATAASASPNVGIAVIEFFFILGAIVLASLPDPDTRNASPPLQS